MDRKQIEKRHREVTSHFSNGSNRIIYYSPLYLYVIQDFLRIKGKTIPEDRIILIRYDNDGYMQRDNYTTNAFMSKFPNLHNKMVCRGFMK